MENRNVPLLQGTKEGLAALNHLIDYSSFLKEQIHYTLSSSKTRQPSKTILKLLSKDEKVLNEFESKKLIEEYGIPVTRNYLCRSKNEVFKRAEELGYPLVMKLISEDIQHKTEAGVVKLNIKNLKEVEQSYDGLISNAFQFKKDAKIKGILCYKMIEDPVTEVIIGIVSDPYFGPAVLFGLGGIFVEVLKDRTLLIPPFTRGEVIKKINSLKGSQLLYGVRGKPEGDIEALTSAVVKVGEIAVNLGKHIDSLDINPLFVFPKGKGVIAVDALISIK
jgi:acetyltransferase